MKRKEVEKKISDAFENSTPDVFNEIEGKLEDKSESNIIDIKMPLRRKHMAKKILSVAATIIIVFGIASAGAYWFTPKAAVVIDVNPSIEIRINSNERVISCTANNEDAKIIIDGMDLRGTDIDVAVNALIGSMLKNGYVNELKNSVLVTVTDAKDGTELQKKLSEEISALLNASIGSSSVASQTLVKDEETKVLAEKYEISEGKASMIKEIAESDEKLKVDELAELSVNELNLLSATRNSEGSGIQTVGEASSKEYIGEEAAKKAALKDYPEVKDATVEFDCDDGKIVYEVEFIYDGIKYDIEIDAITGECIDVEEEKADAEDEQDMQENDD